MRRVLFAVVFAGAFWAQASIETPYDRAVRIFWTEHPDACPCDGCCEQRFEDGAWQDFLIGEVR